MKRMLSKTTTSQFSENAAFIIFVIYIYIFAYNNLKLTELLFVEML